MGLSQALSNAYSGLSASSRQAEVAAHNIANSATEGYQRREVNLSSQSVDGQGRGVLVDGTSLASSALTADRREANAEYAYQDIIADAASTLASMVGDSDDPSSMFTRYQDFEDSLALLAETPDSTQLQIDVLNSATDIVDSLNEANEDLLDLRQQTDRQIAQQVDALNELLAEFDEVNDNIEKFYYRGEDVTEMSAQREALIDQISSYIPVTAVDRPGERVALMTDSGYTLVDANAPTIEFTAANVVDPTMDLRGGSPGALSGLTINGVDVTPGVANDNPLGGGSLDALFEVRDGSTVEFQTSLDAMARDLIDRFDDATVDPTITAGNPGLFTDGQTADTGAVGLAQRIEVNNAVDPDNGGALWRLRDGMEATAEGDSGDNTILVAMLGATTSENSAPTGSGLSGTGSLTDFASEFSSKYSTASYSADAALALRSSRYETLYQQEQAETGVDLDYELQNLTLIQTAYSANARVMEVVDQMLQRLMEI